MRQPWPQTKQLDLSLSQNYHSERYLSRFILFICSVMTSLSFSLLQRHFTNIDVIRETAIISVASLTFYFLNLHQAEKLCQLFSWRKGKKNISLLVLSSIVFLQAPGYPLISLLFLFPLIYSRWQQCKYQQTSSYHVHYLLQILSLSFITLYLFTQQRILRISWEILFFLPLLIVLFLLFIFLINLVDRSQTFLKRGRRYIIYSALGMIGLVNLLAALAQIYLAIHLQLILLGVALVANLGVMAIYLCFLEDFIIFLIFPESFHRQIMFRIHNRRFTSSYSSQICQRNIPSQCQECFLCTSTATIVYFQCGHLTLCTSCHSKYNKKLKFTCLICLERYNTTAHFDQRQKYIRFLLGGTVLKQVPLPKNYAFKNVIPNE